MLNNQDFTHDRTKYLGGSDIGAILGLSKYRTPLEVWLEKTGKAIHAVNNLPIRFGTYAEEFVANEYAAATGYQVAHQPEPIIHGSHAYLQGHIDRLVFSKASEKANKPSHLLECKTANPFARAEWGESGTDEVPLPYLTQCHWYLALAQLERCDLAVLFGNSEFRIYQIEQDKEVEKALLEKAVEFWENHVITDIPPPPQTNADYQSLFQKEVLGKTVSADKKMIDLIARFHELTNDVNDKEDLINQIKQCVMGQMGDAEKLTYEGQTIATWKKPKASFRFDGKRFESDYPALFPQYQVPIQNSRRLVIKP